MKLKAILLRAGDLIRSFGRPPYHTPPFIARNYSLRAAINGLADSLLAVPGISTPLYLFINGEKVKFTVDAKGRTHLPLVLRRRL